MTTIDEEARIEEIAEGIYRWTIDVVNETIEIAAKIEGGLKKPILGTGKAPLLSPSEAKAAITALLVEARLCRYHSEEFQDCPQCLESETALRTKDTKQEQSNEQ